MIREVGYILLVFGLFAGGCKDPNTSEKKEDPPVSIDISQEEAVTQIQYYVNNTGKTIMVSQSYYEWESQEVKCSQYDIDLGRNCSEPRPGAPYGYRTIRRRIRKCCKWNPERIQNMNGTWKARHSLEDDQWTVTLEVDNGELKRTLQWLLDDNNGNIEDTNVYDQK